MTTTCINPATTAKPTGPYSQAILSTGSGSYLHIAGQVGILPDGSLAEGFAAQTEAAWTNIQAILAAAGMDASNLVKIVSYITDAKDLAVMGPIRLTYLGDARPAATTVVVKALAKPEWVFEIEAVAYKS